VHYSHDRKGDGLREEGQVMRRPMTGVRERIPQEMGESPDKNGHQHECQLQRMPERDDKVRRNSLPNGAGISAANGSLTIAWKSQKTTNPTGKQKRNSPRVVCPKGPLGANRRKNSKSGVNVPIISADRTRRVRRRGNAAAA